MKVCEICEDSLHENESATEVGLCIACGEFFDNHLGGEAMTELMMSLTFEIEASVTQDGWVNREELADALVKRAELIRTNTYNPPDWRSRV